VARIHPGAWHQSPDREALMHVEPYLIVVMLSSGRWVVACERCQTTVAECDTAEQADRQAAAHTCPQAPGS
jgi:hypothetical protein